MVRFRETHPLVERRPPRYDATAAAVLAGCARRDASGGLSAHAQDEASPPSKKVRPANIDLRHDIDMRYAQ